MWHAVGHEIMSPLQSLMVLHPQSDDTSHRYVQRMQQAVKQLRAYSVQSLESQSRLHLAHRCIALERKLMVRPAIAVQQPNRSDRMLMRLIQMRIFRQVV